MARVVECFFSFTCTPRAAIIGGTSPPLLHTNTFIHEWNEPHIFAFPADTARHLPTPEGWDAELAWAPPQ